MPAKQPAKTNILYKKTVLYASVVFVLRHYGEYLIDSHSLPTVDFQLNGNFVQLSVNWLSIFIWG